MESIREFAPNNPGGLIREIVRIAPYAIRDGFEDKELPKVVFKFLKPGDKKGSGRSGLRLIALRVNDGTSEKNRKALLPGVLYPFDQAYSFGRDEQGKETVKLDFGKSLALFDVFNQKGKKTIDVNVSAVVGKNGSGKSSLVELMMMAINNVTALHDGELSNKQFQPQSELDIEWYFHSSRELFRLAVKGEEAFLTEFMVPKEVDNHQGNREDFYVEGETRPFELGDFDNFFYTVLINYSHFSLNSKHDRWLDPIFRKNDGYQAPFLISPYREEGNMDINRQYDFVQSRLLANLFEQIEDGDPGIRQLTNSHLAVRVEFKLKSKEEEKENPKEGKRLHEEYMEKMQEKRQEILDTIGEVFDLLDKERWKSKGESSRRCKEYLFQKMFKMLSVSGANRDGRDPVEIASNPLSLAGYLKSWKDKPTHMAVKFKQAVNFLKFSLFPEQENFSVEINETATELAYFLGREEGKGMRLIELLPPPFFEPSIKVRDNRDPQNLGEEIDLEVLSSGEKQRIHSVSSILYHLRNIESVSEDMPARYSSVNLVLDEIELYYHPDLQRTFLHYLHGMIRRIPLENIGAINILFCTHSPFILSDIPSHNVLKLKDGKPIEMDFNTLGANIHDLLKQNFFMEGGLIGQYALEMIRDLAGFLESKNPKSETKDERDNREFEWSGKSCESDPLIPAKVIHRFLRK